jgi:DNA-binding Lrp family transcriptional regulator
MRESSRTGVVAGAGDPGDWWGAIDGEILECLAERGTMTLEELCDELGVSAGEATAFVAMLAREGKLRIARVELAA